MLVILTEQRSRVIRFEFLIVLLLCAYLLTGVSISLTNAVAEFGNVIPLDNEIPPAYFALVQTCAILQLIVKSTVVVLNRNEPR